MVGVEGVRVVCDGDLGVGEVELGIIDVVG